MVHLQMKTTSKEVPISDIIATGQIPFFTDLSENSAEFKGQSNIDRFRLIYNGKVLKEEELTKITDNDYIRVILLPESKIKKPTEDASKKQSLDRELQILTDPFRLQEDNRIYPFSMSFDLPDHVRNALKAHPQLVFDSHLLCVVKNWNMYRSYCIWNVYRGDATRNMFKYNNPEFMNIVKGFTYALGGKHSYVFGQQRLEQRAAAAPAPAPAGPPLISPAALQNALQAALAGVAPPAPAPVRAQPPPPQPAEEPMQQGYEQQAATLREYGFENDDLIQLALEQSNGDVQAAMEFLIELQN